ncbi:hypothetical protein AG4045_019569 [Apium graveolens]|uniref:Uncharacterized protein n=1 Tax=Apium graveolens TaxID=4045 RepID=A0A6L5BBE7_APIGR|nr:hypothetical protein AG4045_019569 [Apium graveolens]
MEMKHLLFTSLLLFNLIFLFSFSQARSSSIVPLPKPALSSFKINTTSQVPYNYHFFLFASTTEAAHTQLESPQAALHRDTLEIKLVSPSATLTAIR